MVMGRKRHTRSWFWIDGAFFLFSSFFLGEARLGTGSLRAPALLLPSRLAGWVHYAIITGNTLRLRWKFFFLCSAMEGYLAGSPAVLWRFQIDYCWECGVLLVVFFLSLFSLYTLFGKRGSANGSNGFF